MNNINSEDPFLFIEDDGNVSQSENLADQNAWNILIIDDDPDVHSATMFALNDLKILSRNLQFLHAYTTAEARQILIHQEDIAVVLLDVVMEKDNTGLQLVTFIRDTLNRRDIRIILRTGQAGYAPEIDAIRDFDINDYKNKTELTQAKLFTAITSAIRSYQQIKIISSNNESLELIVGASSLLMTANTLTSFSQLLLDYIIELLQCNVHGFVYTATISTHEVHAGIDTELGPRVIVATDQFEDYLNKSTAQIGQIGQFGQIEELQLVQKALFEQRHLFHSQQTALYLSNLNGAAIVVYLDQGFEAMPYAKHMVELFCSNASVCLQNVMLNSKMHNLAFYDPLTGLANRLQLLQNLQQTLHSQQRAESVLALIDINHFAETNDALGHRFGDVLLHSVGQRLRNHFGENCKIARIGNDIFALLGHEVIVSPKLILSLFNTAFSVENQAVQLSVSLGLLRLADYELSAPDALKDANIALKRTKSDQRSDHTYFTREMGVEIRERVRMMHALRAAFEDERLYIVYQPQVEIDTGKPFGAEALLRWKTDDGASIPPDQFIPIAEYSGLIVNIGEWVLRTACFELVRITELGLQQFRMAVNVSQAQFMHPLFLHMLKRALDDSGIQPHNLELEITESMAMTDPDLVIANLEKMKAMGVRISIDDFGTGFSSLSQLQKLKVNKLKIDRTFINEIGTGTHEGSIAKMIVELSQSLQLEVIAEGVENQLQADTLKTLGCRHAQGFLYAKPKNKNDLYAWLKQHI